MKTAAEIYLIVWGTMLALALASWIVITHKAAKRAERAARESMGLCGNCGYDLTGNVSGTCPECGRVTVK